MELKQRFFAAAEAGDLTRVTRCLQFGADINATYENKSTALTAAARNGHLPVVEKLVASGATVAHANKYGDTALIFAASRGHDAVVAYLLNNGANSEQGNRSGANALTSAAWNGHANVIVVLLAAGLNPNHANTNGDTALTWAASKGHDQVIATLLQTRANVNHVNHDGDTALHLAAFRGYDSTVQMLLDAGADPEMLSGAGMTPVAVAAQRGHPKVVRLLQDHKHSTDPFSRAAMRANLQAGQRCLINLDPHQNRTAIHVAAKHGQLDILKMLLVSRAAGFSIDERDDAGWTALHFACEGGHTTAVKMLLSAGAKLNAVDTGGHTPMVMAVWHGHLEVVRELCRHGASLSVLSSDGQSILHHAVGHPNNNCAVVEYLMSQNVSVSSTDNTGCTALHVAVRLGRADILQQLLVHAKEIVNTRNHAGQTPLVLAASLGMHAIALQLLTGSAGVEVDVQDVDGASALFVASSRGDAPLVHVLLQHGALPTLATHDGSTPLSVAKTEEIRSVLQLYHNCQQFRERCLAMLNDQEREPTVDELVDVVPLITSVYDLRLLLALLSLVRNAENDNTPPPPSSASRTGAAVLNAAFAHIITHKLVFDISACVFFKLVLEKCVEQELLSRGDFLMWDRQAENVNTESADWVQELKKHIYDNSWRLDAHDQCLRSVAEGIKQVHAVVMENRTAVKAVVTRVDSIQKQVEAGKRMMNEFMSHGQRLSSQMQRLQQRLEKSETNIVAVARNLQNFHGAYVSQQQHEVQKKKLKLACGLLASVAGFVFAPLLQVAANAVIDFGNPIEIFELAYEQQNVVAFLMDELAANVLDPMVSSQLEKLEIPQDQFMTLLREEIATQRPELVEQCAKREQQTSNTSNNRVRTTDRSCSIVDIVTTHRVRESGPVLESEAVAVQQILRELQAAVEHSANNPRQQVQQSGFPLPRTLSVSSSTSSQDREWTSLSMAGSNSSIRPERASSARAVDSNETPQQRRASAPPRPVPRRDAPEPANADETVEFLDDPDAFPYHVAVQESGGQLAEFLELVEVVAGEQDDPMAPMALRLHSQATSQETMCATQYAYWLGYTAVAAFLEKRLQRNGSTSSATVVFDTTPAISVELLADDVDDFAYICIVHESQGCVEECAFLCDVVDEDAHALDATTRAVVRRQGNSREVQWTAVELASHLGYVEIVKHLLKEVCKHVPTRDKILALKFVRDRALQLQS